MARVAARAKAVSIDGRPALLSMTVAASLALLALLLLSRP
jgi:hypothetical protein